MSSKYPMVTLPVEGNPPVLYLTAPVSNTNLSSSTVRNAEALNVKVLNVKVPNAETLNVKAPDVEALNVEALNVEVPNLAVPNVTVQRIPTSVATADSSGATAVAPNALNGQPEVVTPKASLDIATFIVNRIAARCEQYMQRSAVVDTDTSFDQLQLDSLAMLEILYELEEELAITLDPTTLPVMTRVGDLAAAVNRARQSAL